MLVKLIGLVQNENMKIYRRMGTWFMFAILVLILCMVAIFTKFILVEPQEMSWRETLHGQNQSIEIAMEESELPVAVLERYERDLQLNKYRLAHDIPPVEPNSFWGYVASTVNLIPVITMFTIVVAAGIVAGEFSLGTIKLLLIRPVSRSKVLFSKYVATLLFGFLLLLSLFLFSLLVGVIFFGAASIHQPHLFLENNVIVERNMFLHLIMLYGLSSVELVMMATFSFMISTVFRNSSLAIGLALFLMFTGTQFVYMFNQYDWVKYILFANTYLIQYFEGSPIVEGMTLNFSMMIVAVYFIIFNLLSWIIFQRRDVTN